MSSGFLSLADLPPLDGSQEDVGPSPSTDRRTRRHRHRSDRGDRGGSKSSSSSASVSVSTAQRRLQARLTSESGKSRSPVSDRTPASPSIPSKTAASLPVEEQASVSRQQVIDPLLARPEELLTRMVEAMGGLLQALVQKSNSSAAMVEFGGSAPTPLQRSTARLTEAHGYVTSWLHEFASGLCTSPDVLGQALMDASPTIVLSANRKPHRNRRIASAMDACARVSKLVKRGVKNPSSVFHTSAVRNVIDTHIRKMTVLQHTTSLSSLLGTRQVGLNNLLSQEGGSASGVDAAISFVTIIHEWLCDNSNPTRRDQVAKSVLRNLACRWSSNPLESSKYSHSLPPNVVSFASDLFKCGKTDSSSSSSSNSNNKNAPSASSSSVSLSSKGSSSTSPTMKPTAAPRRVTPSSPASTAVDSPPPSRTSSRASSRASAPSSPPDLVLPRSAPSSDSMPRVPTPPVESPMSSMARSPSFRLRQSAATTSSPSPLRKVAQRDSTPSRPSSCPSSPSHVLKAARSMASLDGDSDAANDGSGGGGGGGGGGSSSRGAGGGTDGKGQVKRTDSFRNKLPRTKTSFLEDAARAAKAAGARAGSQAGIKLGGAAGSIAGAEVARRGGTLQEARAAGAEAGAAAGAKAGARAGCEVGAEVGSVICGDDGRVAGARVASQVGSKAGSKSGAVAGESAAVKAWKKVCRSQPSKSESNMRASSRKDGSSSRTGERGGSGRGSGSSGSGSGSGSGGSSRAAIERAKSSRLPSTTNA